MKVDWQELQLRAPKTNTEAADQSASSLWMPWDAAVYGGDLVTHIAPVIVSHDLSLTVFYSQVELSGEQFFYMGAFATCLAAPFRIHSMSKYPIANDKRHYTTDSAPTGLRVSDTRTHLMVALAKHTMSVSISALLDSLSLVNSCPLFNEHEQSAL
jgi:hypothetical protein